MSGLCGGRAWQTAAALRRSFPTQRSYERVHGASQTDVGLLSDLHVAEREGSAPFSPDSTCIATDVSSPDRRRADVMFA